MEKVEKKTYEIDYDFLAEMEKEDEDVKKVYNVINKDLIEKEELKKMEEIKKNADGVNDFKFEALKDIISEENWCLSLNLQMIK